MRSRRLTDRHADAVCWGVHLSFLSSELVEFFGALGFRWLFLDAQHTPLDVRLCQELVRAADAADMFCMVRVAEIKAPVIARYLDVGVLGILAPNVSSAAEASALVAAVKFSPLGIRGAALHSRAARFGLIQSPGEYCRTANQETFAAALIESQSGIEELDSIAAVPGLDYVSIGANDLALSLGIADGALDSRVQVLVEGAAARIRVLGKPQLTVVRDAVHARAAAAAGARLIAVSDAALLADAGRLFLETAKSGHAIFAR